MICKSLSASWSLSARSCVSVSSYSLKQKINKFTSFHGKHCSSMYTFAAAINLPSSSTTLFDSHASSGSMTFSWSKTYFSILIYLFYVDPILHWISASSSFFHSTFQLIHAFYALANVLNISHKLCFYPSCFICFCDKIMNYWFTWSWILPFVFLF